MQTEPAPQPTVTEQAFTSRLTPQQQASIAGQAASLVHHLRNHGKPSLMEQFLAEYGLATDEGLALMGLAEALLRVPDATTADALLQDKLASGQWRQHFGKSRSLLINSATLALWFAAKLLANPVTRRRRAPLRQGLRWLSKPLIRVGARHALGLMGRQFVLGETIESAMRNARALEAKGYTYSYDMLGEAALTAADARRYQRAYQHAIARLASQATKADLRLNPGISIKLSALHPRYETMQQQRVMAELVPRVRKLALQAKAANIGMTLDAEENARLDLSLRIIAAVLADPLFKNWGGFGVVVQAYNRRARAVIDRLYEMSVELNTQLMVRLVKGAYWDSEIKQAQTEGHAEFPVFTDKAATDVSYLRCAEKLLTLNDRLYPQFATHNAHTLTAVLALADKGTEFELQRLHGMGDALHEHLRQATKSRCRIYAPVGPHQDLLAYLVRRMLENGANASFVHQLMDHRLPASQVAANPFSQVPKQMGRLSIQQPSDLFAPRRENSAGPDLANAETLLKLDQQLAQYDGQLWEYEAFSGHRALVHNPATGRLIGSFRYATPTEALNCCDLSRSWHDSKAAQRAALLKRTADLYQRNAVELYSLLMQEAGKTLADCVNEVREAIDFLRYYAVETAHRPTQPAGIFVAISPWNFPLAIFTGQIAAALATGNGVLAKPAEATSLIAHLAISLFHQAGVPARVLTLVCGDGPEIGSLLVTHPAVNGVCFTGSTTTAQSINRAMAEHLAPTAALIAETGGLNAMIVDSTALPEQAVADILTSAFQSAGQRCSALRILYLQEDIAEDLLELLFGAMEELSVGDPRSFANDIGPVIHANAAAKITAYIAQARAAGQLLKQIEIAAAEPFVAPAVIAVSGIGDLEDEIFGPVLHVATFANKELAEVVNAINAKGYGLTLGVHSRIEERVQQIITNSKVGNLYVNRNQIGAIVGSQPFGGHGLSGTGPKAGGPKYLSRFIAVAQGEHKHQAGWLATAEDVEAAFAARPQPTWQPVLAPLPGPIGEKNLYLQRPRGRVLCLGPDAASAAQQYQRARQLGCQALAIAPGVEDGIDGVITPAVLQQVARLEAVVSFGADLAPLRQALAERVGPLVPLLTDQSFVDWLMLEQTICLNTAAVGGAVDLLASQ